MANYERYTPEFQASDGRIYGVKDKDAREEIASLNSALNEKADKVGSSPDLIAGTAEQLMSSDMIEDAVPYLYRKSGGGVEVGNRERLEKIVGGTVAWNQQINMDADTWETSDGGFGVKTADGMKVYPNRFTETYAAARATEKAFMVADHVYYIFYSSKSLSGNAVGGGIYPNGQGATYRLNGSGTKEYLFKKSNVWYLQAGFTCGSNNVTENDYIIIDKGVCVDITQMLGSTIADYIYGLETATAGSGLAWLKAHGFFTNSYYAYDAGSLQSVQTSARKVVGFNQWDEEWEVGQINGTTGAEHIASNSIRSKNYSPCIPGATYAMTVLSATGNYIFRMAFYDRNNLFVSSGPWAPSSSTVVAPSNACYFRITTQEVGSNTYGGTYKHDICINLSDSSRNGEYSPYEKHSYPLDSSLTLRGIPKLDSNNKLYYDGDTYASDGTVTRNIKRRIFNGSENWIDYPGETGWVYVHGIFNDNEIPLKLLTRDWGIANILQCVSNISEYRGVSGIISTSTANSGRNLYVILPSGIENASAWKSHLAANNMVLDYLVTPTTEQADPYATIQVVDPYGTEEFVSDSIVPVGHATKYPADLVKKLEGLPWNFATLIAPTESTTTATQPYAIGSYLILNNTLYKVTSAIANGGTITPGTNVTATTIMAELAVLA